MLGEAHRVAGEAVEVGRGELGPAVGPEQVAVERVHQDDHRVAGLHPASLACPGPGVR